MSCFECRANVLSHRNRLIPERMHRQDMRLYHLLVQDPRISYRELAERTGVSLQAIHKQVQAMQEEGVLNGSIAMLSSSYLNAIDVFVYGRAEGDIKSSELVDSLRQDDRIGYVMYCASGMVYVTGILKRAAEMDDFVQMVKRTCHMSQATLAIETMSRAGDMSPHRVLGDDVKLSPLDLRIVSAMRFDARKTYQQLAEEVGVTARTVRQRVERMLEEGTVLLVLLFDSTRGQSISSVIHVHFKEGVDRNAFGAELMNEHQDEVLFYRIYANIPDMIVVATNHERIGELYQMTEMLEKDKRVRSVRPDIVLSAWGMETWRDRVLPPPGK